jgi:hypothetical protein
VFVTLHFPLIDPPFVVFWEYVSLRGNVVVLAKRSLHLEDVPPQVVLSAQMPSAWEVVYLLVLINVLQLVWFDQPCPQNVPARATHQSEASSLERVHHAIVSVSGIIDFKSKRSVRLQVFLGKPLNPFHISLETTLHF